MTAPACTDALASTTMDKPRRDLMAPDTEPTDEELELVMKEAHALAMHREGGIR